MTAVGDILPGSAQDPCDRPIRFFSQMIAEPVLCHVMVVNLSADRCPADMWEQSHGGRVDDGLCQATFCRPVKHQLVVQGRLHHDHRLVLRCVYKGKRGTVMAAASRQGRSAMKEERGGWADADV